MFLEHFTQAIDDHFAQMGGELEVSGNLHSPSLRQSLASDCGAGVWKAHPHGLR